MAVFLGILKILGSLGVFLYGMKVMSEAIQRIAGDKLRASLKFMTRNRFLGILSGFLVTTIIQSSSATTVMLVSFANAKLITLVESIGVIMGANLGTTITFWIVSIFGFKFSITTLALPAIGIGIFLLFAKSQNMKDKGELLIGFGLLFQGLSLLKKSVPDIKNNPDVLEFLSHYTNMGYGSLLIFVLVGVILTVVVQSSSAAGAITVTMAFKGWIGFETAAAIVLGENIGTTITAYLASLGANVHAKRTARAHFIFNILGVIWMLVMFFPFMRLIDYIVPGDYMIAEHIPLHLSAFHSMFNLCNIVLLVWFVPQIAKLVERLVQLKPEDIEDEEDGEYRLQYISTGMLNASELSLYEAQKEISNMAEIVQKMYKRFLKIFHSPDEDMGKLVKKVKHMEKHTDDMEEQITDYLIACSRENLTEQGAYKTNSLIKVVSELESMADSVLGLTHFVQQRYYKQMKFHESAEKEIKNYSEQVIKFMQFNIDHLKDLNFSEKDLQYANELESDIDQTRYLIRSQSIKRMKEGARCKTELLFLDIVKSFEKLGDYSLNISEALRNLNENSN